MIVQGIRGLPWGFKGEGKMGLNKIDLIIAVIVFLINWVVYPFIFFRDEHKYRFGFLMGLLCTALYLATMYFFR